MNNQDRNQGRLITGILIGIIAALFSCVIVIGGLLLALSEGGVRLSLPEPSLTGLPTNTQLSSSTNIPTIVPQPTETTQPTETNPASSSTPISTSSPTETFTATALPTFTQPAPPPPTLVPIIPPQPPPGCGAPASWVTYVIQPGDTLFSIGRAYGVSVEQLKFANCLASDTIHAGQLLSVPNIPPRVPTSTNTAGPVATQTPIPPSTALPTNTLPPPVIPTQPPNQNCGAPASWVTYVVQPGDTVYSISSAYSITINQLMYANCLNSPYISPGQTLLVPPRPPIPTNAIIPVASNTPPPTTVPPSDTPLPAPTETSPLPTSTSPPP